MDIVLRVSDAACAPSATLNTGQSTAESVTEETMSVRSVMVTSVCAAADDVM